MLCHPSASPAAPESKAADDLVDGTAGVPGAQRAKFLCVHKIDAADFPRQFHNAHAAWQRRPIDSLATRISDGPRPRRYLKLGGRLCAEPEERDPETYDDAELYQQLLKEFLESSAGAGGRGTHVILGVQNPVPVQPCHRDVC